jgi:tRNA A37 threonylcarbamoyltransferase TsaD
MDIISAYREVGTYCGAAVACGTTHKTVKRAIARHEAGGVVPERAARAHNYEAGTRAPRRTSRHCGRDLGPTR